MYRFYSFVGAALSFFLVFKDFKASFKACHSRTGLTHTSKAVAYWSYSLFTEITPKADVFAAFSFSRHKDNFRSEFSFVSFRFEFLFVLFVLKFNWSRKSLVSSYSNTIGAEYGSCVLVQFWTWTIAYRHGLLSCYASSAFALHLTGHVTAHPGSVKSSVKPCEYFLRYMRNLSTFFTLIHRCLRANALATPKEMYTAQISFLFPIRRAFTHHKD